MLYKTVALLALVGETAAKALEAPVANALAADAAPASTGLLSGQSLRDLRMMLPPNPSPPGMEPPAPSPPDADASPPTPSPPDADASPPTPSPPDATPPTPYPPGMAPPTPFPPGMAPPSPAPPPDKVTPFTTRVTTIVAGDVSQFTPAKLAEIKTAVCDKAKISPNGVKVSATPGSFHTSSPNAIVTVIFPMMTNATAIKMASGTAGGTNTVKKTNKFYKDLVKATSTPSITVEPGDNVIAIPSKDPSGLTILPGTNRLVTPEQVAHWYRLKAIWKDTAHAGKEIPVHDIDPASLPCLLAAETAIAKTVAGDTVPLKRDGSINCDGTPHRRLDGKPVRHYAVAHEDIKPTK